MKHRTLETNKQSDPYIRNSRLTRTMAKGLLAMALFSTVAETAQAHEISANGPVAQALGELTQLSTSCQTTILSGKTSNIYIKQGAKLYTHKGENVVTTRLPYDFEVLHATYAEKGREKIGSFRLGETNYSIRLDDPSTQRHIREVRPYGQHPLKSFQLDDIATKDVSVDYMRYGFAFTESGSAHDPLAGEVEGHRGKLVPIAQGASTE
jgi:hypothetical protein